MGGGRGAAAPRLTYIVVPGGGTDGAGRPLAHVGARLDRAAELYYELRGLAEARPGAAERVALLCLSQGTTHKPGVVGADGYAITEAAASVRYLVERKHVPPMAVQEEAFSWDTVGNAYFARMLFVEPAAAAEAVVITNEWHMPRAEAIFRRVFGLGAGGGGGDPRGRLRAGFRLRFVSVPDALEAGAAAARRRHEARSLRAFEENTRGVRTLRDLQHWLFTRHDAYASQRHFRDWRAELDAGVLASY